MEALNKESEFAMPVLTWAQTRSDLREKSTVGKFVRSSLQGLNHEDVLLKLETKIVNNRPFHSCVLSYLAMNASEAGGDLALIQTSLLFSCKCHLVSIRT